MLRVEGRAFSSPFGAVYNSPDQIGGAQDDYTHDHGYRSS